VASAMRTHGTKEREWEVSLEKKLRFRDLTHTFRLVKEV